MTMPTAPMPQQRPPAAQPRSRSRVDAGRLWSGGAATAVVGIFFTRWSQGKAAKQSSSLMPSLTPLPGGGVLGLGGRIE